jgi:3-(3-hydroxy-phenyl)propionate hydroxylase
LAWKLDLILAGKAPADLLDTYASERVPHVDAMINFSMALGRVICVADPTEAEMRDKSMIAAHQAGEATTSPPAVAIGPGITRRGDPLGGQRFLQGRVQQGQRSGRFDDLVGRGWVLLSCQTDPAALLDDDIAAFFRSIGGVTVRIGGGAVRDLDGVYEKWLAQAGVASVLQRPDFYLFGAAPEAGDTNALVSDLRQALTQPPRG